MGLVLVQHYSHSSTDKPIEVRVPCTLSVWWRHEGGQCTGIAATHTTLMMCLWNVWMNYVVWGTGYVNLK